jgi:inner membrane protein
MPTIVGHAVVIATAGVLGRARLKVILWAIGCAVLPDLDVFAYSFGVRWDSMLGHRGLTHTVLFALGLGPFAAWLGFRARPRRELWRLAALFSAATLSHPVLDAFTNGGLGIPFFWPLAGTRYFMPWTPLEVSPFFRGFFSARGAAVALSELKWLGLPCASALALYALARALRTADRARIPRSLEKEERP